MDIFYVDVPTLQLHGPNILQMSENLGDGNATDADHGGQLLVGVVGGFPEIPAMEDVVFVRRMEEVGRTTCLPGPMVCSPRRWEGRPLRTLALWVFMQAMFDLGASPLWLAKFYRPHKGSEDTA